MVKRLFFIEAGSCDHAEWMVLTGGRRAKRTFPASVAVIEQATAGIILFDTGYSERFHEQTRHFPERLYALATPVSVTPAQTAVAQLRTLGIQPRDVRWIVCSHFHADHIGGLADFPEARYVYSREGYEAVRDLSRLGALRAGFLRGLLPPDFEARSLSLPLELFNRRNSDRSGFNSGYDLAGDGSVSLVQLPGHAAGQLGAIVTESSGRATFLVADACWLGRSYRENIGPHPLANLIFDDRHQYARTLKRIHDFSKRHPEVRVVPCHCSETLGTLAT